MSDSLQIVKATIAAPSNPSEAQAADPGPLPVPVNEFKRQSHAPRFGLSVRAATMVILAAFACPSTAVACGGIFDVACNLSHGGLSPENIQHQAQDAAQNAANAMGAAGQAVGNAINELQASLLSGPTLEQAIRASHDTAINGTMPIPAEMRRQLTGYASEDSLNRVRYKIGDGGFLNLAHLLEQGGAAAAVTLDDVVIFNGPTEAADPSIWAHELTHVDQYRAGIHSFAVQYARNWRSVEDPAYAQGNGFWNWRQQHQFQQQQQPQAQSQGFPGQVALGVFCYTPYGRYGPGPVQPQGSPCYVNLPQGTLWGQVGP